MSKAPQSEPESTGVRRWLAFGLTGLSILFVFALAVVIIVADHEHRSDTAKYVLTAVLPLIGTWVGTILTHYFSKESFEAATRSVTEVARQITSLEKLRSLPVKDTMIPRAQMVAWISPQDDNTLLFAIRDELTKRGKGRRVPILSTSGQPLYVIHQSTIDSYLTDRLKAEPAPDKKTLTLRKFLDDKEGDLENTFATVREDASLADAKEAMDAAPNCQDVFVTNTGTKSDPVLGWITNNIIQDNGKV